jgi:hypothetical protein
MLMVTPGLDERPYTITTSGEDFVESVIESDVVPVARSEAEPSIASADGVVAYT